MRNFFIKIWNACYYFVQGVWNTIVTGSKDGTGSGGLNGTGNGLLLFILIAVGIVALIVALIVIGAIRKRKKKAKKQKEKGGNAYSASAIGGSSTVSEPVSQPQPVSEPAPVVAVAPVEQPKEEPKEEPKKKETPTMVVPEGPEARKTQIILATLKTGREHPAAGSKAVSDLRYDDVEETVDQKEAKEEQPVEEYQVVGVYEKKKSKKKTTKKKEQPQSQPVEDDEKKALKAEIEKLRADKEAEKEARHKAELDAKQAEIERLKKEKEEEKAKAEEIAKLKAEKEEAERKAKEEAEQARKEAKEEARKAKEQAKKEAEEEKKRAKAEAEAEKKKAKEEAEKAKAQAQKEAEKAKADAEKAKAKAEADAEKAKADKAKAEEKAKAATVAATAAVAAAEKKAKEAEKKAEDDKKYSGKWAIEQKSADEFIAKLSALNGEVMLSSEIYSTEKGARNGIATLIKNITNTGKFEIYQDKNKNYYYKLKNSTNRILCVGEIYKSKDQCEKAVESVKRIASNSIIVTELIEGAKYIEYQPEKLDEEEVMSGTKGKWRVEVNADGKFNAKLYASNGQLMLSTEEVSQEETAKNNIKSVRTNAQEGNFIIDKDKFGRFYYKLRNAQKTVICIGESYDTVEGVKHAIESVRRFAMNSPVVSGEEDVVAATKVEEKKPVAKKATTAKKPATKKAEGETAKKATTAKKTTPKK